MKNPEPTPPKSFGPMSDAHWSRARVGTNDEALQYYRQRSTAPGVAEGGGARNAYCMRCDGVIPLGTGSDVCPHCGAEPEGRTRRYFNWVETNEAPASDARALLPIALVLVGIAALAAAVAWMFIA